MTDDTGQAAFADAEDRDPMPCWFMVGADGIPVINGQLLRYDMFSRQTFTWENYEPDLLLRYLEAAHRWILDGALPKPPSAGHLKSVK